jgi:hypothetical protein
VLWWKPLAALLEAECMDCAHGSKREHRIRLLEEALRVL